MNFFEHQDKARQGTSKLYIYLGLAVLGIIISIYVLIAGLMIFSNQKAETEFELAMLFEPSWLIGIVGGTLTVIIFGSLYKMSELSGGGRVVAESMGGRLLNHNTADRVEQRLLNVVDEMAIASGVPSPPVYLMDHEQGINAFAAGHKINNSVIGVTRGTAELLTRDELQGVMAHEFSHILNGDVKINLRLIGLTHGIMLIGIIGYYLMRSTVYSSYSRSRDKGGNVLPLIGIGLMVIGFIGTFFGNLIKASVSRQREFLADASAVQFTRNPEGIAGALKRIGGYKNKSEVKNAHASEISHMFFATGVTSSLAEMFATHPPLDVRIKRIDPSWQSGWHTAPHQEFSADTGTHHFAGQAQVSQPRAIQVQNNFKTQVMDQIGVIESEQVSYAHDLLERMPRAILRAAHDAYGARALILTMLIVQDEADDQAQLKMLQQQKIDPNLLFQIRQLLPKMHLLQEKDRLPLIDICLPHLVNMSTAQRSDFIQNLRRVIGSDRKVDLFEWSLARILEHHLNITILPPPPETESIASDSEKVSFLISWLAHMGHSHQDDARKAHAKAMAHAGSEHVQFYDYQACSLPAISQTLDQLASFTLNEQRKIIETALVCITADGTVTVREYEILRAIVTTWDIPMPPLNH